MNMALTGNQKAHLMGSEGEGGRSSFAALLSGSRPVWCVTATYPQAERRAHASLHRAGFQAYLPLITVRWADRTWHTKPLFTGYLFVRMHLDRPWNPVRYAPGVYSLLSIDGIPSICPDTVVEALRATETARNAPPLPQDAWTPGMPCSLAIGPFSGHQAVVTQVGDDMALVALIMFGEVREVAVQLDCLKTRDN